MKRFEYSEQFVEIKRNGASTDTAAAVAALNLLGNEGWELLERRVGAVRPQEGGRMAEGWSCLMKREVDGIAPPARFPDDAPKKGK